MALPKALDRIEAKLDEILALLTRPQVREEAELDPAAFAAGLDYDTYTAKEVIDRAPSLTAAERQALLRYEETHANRKTVIEALSA